MDCGMNCSTCKKENETCNGVYEPIADMELKPCPFCGAYPRIWDWNGGTIVECKKDDHRIQCEA